MIVTDLQVTKLKHGLYHVDCRVLRLGNPLLTEVDRWEYECPDLVVVQAICMSYMKREVLYVVGKDSWLHRCRTARPGSVVLSVRWDGSSGDKRPALPSPCQMITNRRGLSASRIITGRVSGSRKRVPTSLRITI
jgi:hypothetical protein